MKYIVYQTINKINNKIYIGVHGTETTDFDGYLGNGISIYRPATYMNPTTPMQHAVKKYGVKNFVRTTLKEFDKEEDAYNLEAELVNEEFLQRPDVYNLALGGKFQWRPNPMREVHMYDMDGNYIRSFAGINIAARTLDPKIPNGSHITRAILEGGTFLQHQWSYEKVDKMPKRKAKKIPETIATPYSGKKVGRFDDNWQLLETFDNLTECRKAGYKNAQEVLKNRREHCKGFRFKYLD